MQETMPPVVRTNVFAIVSIICGGVSILSSCFCYGFPFNILGLVFGGVALMQIGTSGEGGRGLAIGGISLSVLSIVLVIGILVMSIFFGAALGVFGAAMGN